MEQVPQWLMDSVAAAGMTCFAEDCDPIFNKNRVMEADSAVPTELPGTIH